MFNFFRFILFAIVGISSISLGQEGSHLKGFKNSSGDATSSWVPGYEQVKENMSLDELLKNPPCKLQKQKNEAARSNVTVMMCVGIKAEIDLKLSMYKPGGTFWFVNEKLRKVDISIGTGSGNYVNAFKSLTDRYGVHMAGPSEEDVRRYDAGVNNQFAHVWKRGSNAIALHIVKLSDGYEMVNIEYLATNFRLQEIER